MNGYQTMLNAKCEMQNAKCRRRAAHHFSFCIGDFAFCILRNRATPRSGLSLTEVLIAMGILTLGLLGVAALFPVGSKYMMDADIADRGSAIAQAAMNDLVTSGMLDPQRWIMFANKPGSVPAISQDARRQDAPWVTVPGNAFTRPVGPALAEFLANSVSVSPEATKQRNLSRQFGAAYVIDPMAIAGASLTSGHVNNKPTAAFPASAGKMAVATSPPTYFTAHWQPWTGSQIEATWPIRRVTFAQPTSASPLANMDPATASYLFRGRDDLATEFPSRDDRAAYTNWDSNAGVPTARQWAGEYSWFATVIPTIRAARNGLAAGTGGFAYDVSVAVCYKRRTGVTAPADTNGLATATDSLSYDERVVKARVLSTGLNGGELLLEDLMDAYTTPAEFNNPGQYPSKSPFQNLKAGQWIMLCGPHPNSTDNEPRFVLHWYQIQSIDKSGSSIPSFNPATMRVVALRGPQWPWAPAASPTATSLSNSLCAGIIRGAVAVHNRTIRLEGNSAWAAK